MAFKFALVLALVAAASAGVLPGAQFETPAKYEFSYGVTDLNTGDIKNAEEFRDGDNVHGSYSLLDADGLKRTVDYTANSDTGFQAEVKREPVATITKIAEPITKVEVTPVATKVIAAPISSYATPFYVTPGAYGALTQVAYSTPKHYTKTVTPFATGVHYAPIPTSDFHYAPYGAVHYAPRLIGY